MAADAQSGFEQHRKPTRRDEFLKTMEALVPWTALCEEIAPHYQKAGNGRPPIGLQRMLRIHFIQYWFNLADLACEEALYDSVSLRRFVGIDLGERDKGIHGLGAGQCLSQPRAFAGTGAPVRGYLGRRARQTASWAAGEL